MSNGIANTSAVRRHGFTMIKVVFLVLALCFGARTVVREHAQLGASLSSIGPLYVAASALLGLVGVWCSSLVWTNSIRAFGAEFAEREARHVFFATQTGKYLPGFVWPYLAQMRFARAFAIKKTEMFAGQLAFLGFHLAFGAVLTACAIPYLVTDDALPRPYLLAVLPAVAFVVVLHPRVFGALTTLAGRGRLTVRPPSPLGFARAAAWMAATWICYASSLFVLTAPLAPRNVELVALCLGGYAFSWIVGFVVVVSPAGVGAREVTLVLCLSLVLSPAEATTVAIASRVLLTGADLLLGLFGAILRGRATTFSVHDEAASPVTAAQGRAA